MRILLAMSKQYDVDENIHSLEVEVDSVPSVGDYVWYPDSAWRGYVDMVTHTWVRGPRDMVHQIRVWLDGKKAKL